MDNNLYGLAKCHWVSQFKVQKVKKFESNSQSQAAQILTNNIQMLSLCLSYFITAVSACDVVTKLVVTQHYGPSFNESARKWSLPTEIGGGNYL